ncbi:ribosomal protein S5 domain 2-type protein [Entophlyctis helioformis]|nr:ribosomal protein S5 domain 2-type protein [Entophlyctis helioformis]
MDRKRISRGPKAARAVQGVHGSKAPPPAAGLRRDGRRPDQLRPMFAKTGTVSQANGSAFLECGAAKILCAVYGPRQLARTASSATAGSLSLDREMAAVLEQALTPAVRLDAYPKSSIQAYVLIIEADGDGAALAAAVTCAALALADAGIEMYDVLDPTHDEETGDCDQQHAQTGSVLLAYMPSLNQVTHLIQSGEISSSQCIKAVELCVDACSQIHAVTQEALSA